MSEIHCPSCRTANESSAVFCGSCGARLAPTAPQPAPQFQSAPMPPQPPQFQSAPMPPQPPQPPQYGAPQYQAPGYQQPPVQPGYGAPGYPYGAPAVAGVPAGMVPAGFGIRLGAYLIDAVILGVVNYVLSAAGASSLNYVLTAVYFICFVALKGQTPGKMALGLHVISADGQPVSWGKAVIRYVGYIISAFILLIGFIMIAFDEQRRGLHDRIAKTLVVKRA